MLKDELISALLVQKGLVTPDQVNGFLRPLHPLDIAPSRLSLSKQGITRAKKLVDRHISAGHPIAVYGDYDVDGICATAIVWEALYPLSRHVFPHIPDRREEGYGLSNAGIDHCLAKGAKLIIVLDSGIVAGSEIKYCQSRGCDILVIDHHQPESTPPRPTALIHSTATSAAGLAWFFAREFQKKPDSESLSLVAISVICDLVPLIGVNRSLAKFGLEELNKTTRPGLLALVSQSGITPGQIGPYEVGFIIGPRLNAMGRLEHAIDSLRLLCTTDVVRAQKLAATLGETNCLRQEMTQKSSDHAISLFAENNLPRLLIAADPDYDEGIIGLVAARLVEKYFRPAIAVSIGREISKASARSVPGFHITEFLRQFTSLFESVGGHEMAAGFTFPTAKLDEVKTRLLKQAGKAITPEILVKNQRIDAVVPLGVLDWDLCISLEQFAPFGIGNPRPVFRSVNIPVTNLKRVGQTAKHLKFSAGGIEAIFFNAPDNIERKLTAADLVYHLNPHIYQGTASIQLVIKDLKSA